MVQFKPIIGRGDEHDHLRPLMKHSYWKLGFDEDMTSRQAIEYLASHGYKCRQNATKRFAMDTVGRYQRGLISYEHLSVHELQSFCKARGLSSKATTASRLARVLDKADDAAIFPRFLELPSEIRNVIYELHFRGLDEITDACRQPPLTLASSQLRAEALPLFYECATFVWEISQHSIRDQDDHMVNFRADAFRLMQVPAAKLSQVKNFGVRLWSERISWRFAQDCITVRLTQRSMKDKAVNFAGSGQSLDDAIHSVLRDFKYWDDEFELQRGHLEALEAAVAEHAKWRWPGPEGYSP